MPSAAEAPTRAAKHSSAVPKKRPVASTATPPSAGELPFHACISGTSPRVALSASAARPATVTRAASQPRSGMGAAAHAMALADTQADRAHAVPPSRTRGEESKCPNADPARSSSTCERDAACPISTG